MELVDTVEAGMNKVVGADRNAILRAAKEYKEFAIRDAMQRFDLEAASASILNYLTSGT